MEGNGWLWLRNAILQYVTSTRWKHVERHGAKICHDAGRSPLGAPPWRFFTRGRASVFRHDPEPYSELLAARS